MPLAYTLEVEIKVKAFPITTDTEAILIARLSVTDNYQISMIVSSSFSSVNHAVIVLVDEFDVSRPKDELACLEVNLACHSFNRNIVTFGVNSAEI